MPKHVRIPPNQSSNVASSDEDKHAKTCQATTWISHQIWRAVTKTNMPKHVRTPPESAANSNGNKHAKTCGSIYIYMVMLIVIIQVHNACLFTISSTTQDEDVESQKDSK